MNRRWGPQTQWYRFAKAAKRVSFIQLSYFSDHFSHKVLLADVETEEVQDVNSNRTHTRTPKMVYLSLVSASRNS